MKIYISKEPPSLEVHVKELMDYHDKKSRLPRVKSVHAAQTPQVCDECHQTYWHKIDVWTPHYPCKGTPEFKREAGFKASE
jgi:hypothetical protein